MLTKKGYSNLLSRIEETGGLTDDMKEDLRRLRDEMDERQGILDRYGESYDGENDEYEFRAAPVEDYREQYTTLKAEYDGLSARYRDMLNNPHDTHETDEAIDEAEGTEVDTDYSNIRISDLITTKEE